MRILIAFEEEYLVYQDVIANTIRALRPHIAVSVTELGTLGAEVARLRPDLVICSRWNSIDVDGKLAWLKVPTGRDLLAELCLDGERSEVSELGLDELLRVVDETEKLVQTEASFRSC